MYGLPLNHFLYFYVHIGGDKTYSPEIEFPPILRNEAEQAGLCGFESRMKLRRPGDLSSMLNRPCVAEFHIFH